MIGDLGLGLRRARVFGITLGIAGLLALSFGVSAHAAGEYELNDTRETAFGPLIGGTDYTATIETKNDVDWYVFYIRTYSQMEFSATMVKCSGCYPPLIFLHDKDGKEISYFGPGDLNENKTFRVTMEAGRYYFRIGLGSVGDRYRFRIDPAASITSSRECGEAIVARDSITPYLAKVSEELQKNGETLATKAAAVKKAKKVVRKLKKRRWASRYTKQSARRKLEEAKRARTTVWKAKLNLERLNSQHQQALAGAEGQIATYC